MAALHQALSWSSLVPMLAPGCWSKCWSRVFRLAEEVTMWELYPPQRRPGRRGWWCRAWCAEERRDTWLKLRGCRTEKQAKKERDRLAGIGWAPRRRLLFRDAVEDWKAFRFKNVAEKTLRRYESIFARWLERWPNRPVSTITGRDVEAYHAGLSDLELGPFVRNLERTLLRAFFAWAVRHRLASQNPAENLPRDPKGSEARDPTRALGQEELARLLAACRYEGTTTCVGRRNLGGRRGKEVSETPQKWTQRTRGAPWLYPLAILGVRTLLRLGTLRQLRWADVDFDAQSLRIPGQIVKTRKPLVIRLDADTLDLLRDLDEENRNRETPSAFVIADLPDARGISRAVARAAVRAGLKGKVGFHSLRKTGASLALQGGTPIEVVKARGGWRSLDVLLKAYRAIAPEEDVAAAEKLARLTPRKKTTAS
ncbi:MAG: tyrosine-type recombinase/integrase [Planctomycetes bacterium]|nr:tyrosine-type recombinase/integrase [Planctomycetota bacterium]